MVTATIMIVAIGVAIISLQSAAVQPPGFNEAVKQGGDPVERPQTPLTLGAGAESPGRIPNGTNPGFDDGLKGGWKNKISPLE